jgi:EAL domain-containing protein (putative c-di-GMP-specific phosphodiesterase class I)
VLIATAVPDTAGHDLPALVVQAAGDLLGPEHLLDLSILDDTAVVMTLGLDGPGASRVGDPALGPALEATLHAALRSAGHPYSSVAVATAGPPKSGGDRARELWQEKLMALQVHTRRQAEDASFRTEIAQLLEGGAIRTMFQAIVGAADTQVLGYEALSRGPAGHRWEQPDLLLRASQRAGLSSLVQWEMARLARVRAKERLTSADHLLFVNAPDTRFWPDAPAEDEEDSVRLWPLNLVVREVSERSPIANFPAVWEARDRGRARGVRFALDDVGAGYAGLAALALLAPEFVKVDMSLVRDCHRDAAKQAVIAALVLYAKQAGAAVIAEGVETADESRVVCDLGVDLLQGFLFARPVEDPCR